LQKRNVKKKIFGTIKTEVEEVVNSEGLEEVWCDQLKKALKNMFLSSKK
jgi:hypothetical protein